MKQSTAKEPNGYRTGMPMPLLRRQPEKSKSNNDSRPPSCASGHPIDRAGLFPSRTGPKGIRCSNSTARAERPSARAPTQLVRSMHF